MRIRLIVSLAASLALAAPAAQAQRAGPAAPGPSSPPSAPAPAPAGPKSSTAPRVMVSVANPLAVQAGLKVLRAGGGAVDTASPLHWCTLGTALLLAAAFFEWARKRFAVQWDAAQQSIEQARLQHAGEAP